MWQNNIRRTVEVKLKSIRHFPLYNVIVSSWIYCNLSWPPSQPREVAPLSIWHGLAILSSGQGLSNLVFNCFLIGIFYVRNTVNIFVFTKLLDENRTFPSVSLFFPSILSILSYKNAILVKKYVKLLTYWRGRQRTR